MNAFLSIIGGALFVLIIYVIFKRIQRSNRGY